MNKRYYSLDTTTDVQNCLTTYQNDPVGMLNCIRVAMNYPQVSTGTIPTVDANTITCIKAVLDKYISVGTPDSSGNMRMPFQTVLTMINDIRACLGLPVINIPATVNCIMSTCMMTAQPSSDITTCVKSCASQNQY